MQLYVCVCAHHTLVGSGPTETGRAKQRSQTSLSVTAQTTVQMFVLNLVEKIFL